MAVNSVSNYQSLIATLGTLNIDGAQTSSTNSTLLDALNKSSDDSNASSSASPSSISTTISQSASLMATLSKISTSDPAKFKEITKGVADDLNEDAKSATDPVQAFTLKKLAAQFSNAALSGSLADISTSLGGGSSNTSSLYGSSGKSYLSTLLTSGQAATAITQVNTALLTNLVESYTSAKKS